MTRPPKRFTILTHGDDQITVFPSRLVADKIGLVIRDGDARRAAAVLSPDETKDLIRALDWSLVASANHGDDDRLAEARYEYENGGL